MRRFLVKKTGDCGSPPTPKKPKADSERLVAAREYEVEGDEVLRLRGATSLPGLPTSRHRQTPIPTAHRQAHRPLPFPRLPTVLLLTWHVTGHRSRRPNYQTSSCSSRAQYGIDLPGSLGPTWKLFFWCLLHNTGVLRWRKDPHSTWTEMALFWSLFTGGSFLVDFLKNEILGFDENLAVVFWSDLQQWVMLPLPPKRLCANGTRKR